MSLICKSYNSGLLRRYSLHFGGSVSKLDNLISKNVQFSTIRYVDSEDMQGWLHSISSNNLLLVLEPVLIILELLNSGVWVKFLSGSQIFGIKLTNTSSTFLNDFINLLAFF